MRKIFVCLALVAFFSGCKDDDDYIETSIDIEKDPALPSILNYDGTLKLSLTNTNDESVAEINLKIHLEYSEAISTNTTHYYTTKGNGTYDDGINYSGEVSIAEGKFSVKHSDNERFLILNFNKGKLSGQTLRLNLTEIQGNEIEGEWINQLLSTGGNLTGNTDCQKGLLPLPQ